VIVNSIGSRITVTGYPTGALKLIVGPIGTLIGNPEVDVKGRLNGAFVRGKVMELLTPSGIIISPVMESTVALVM